MEKDFRERISRLFIDIGLSLSPMRQRGIKHQPKFEKSDIEALRSDWDAVGAALWSALEEFDTASDSNLNVHKNKLQHPIAISYYIIHRGIETQKQVYPRHLQQILFYLQVHWLVFHDHPLFPERIRKMKLGPTVESVLKEFLHYGCEPFSYTPSFPAWKIAPWKPGSYEQFDPGLIPGKIREEMDPIIDSLLSYHYHDLIHKSIESPLWLKDEERILAGEEVTYRHSELLSHFLDHPEEMDTRSWNLKVK